MSRRRTAPTPPRLAGRHELLPLTDPLATIMEGLRSEDVVQRRAAAAQLAESVAERSVEETTVAQLTDIAMAETDAQVWRDLLHAVKSTTGDAAVRMAYVGTGHAAAEVRRQSCGYLAAHSDPRHASVLLLLLNDPNHDVALRGRRGARIAWHPR